MLANELERFQRFGGRARMAAVRMTEERFVLAEAALHGTPTCQEGHELVHRLAEARPRM